MTWTLISATPSPYARKVRVALQEKNIPFTLQTEVPWDATTQTPQYNPLEKLPILIINDDKNTVVYESHHILDWLETKYPDPPLLPRNVDDRLFAKQVEVVTDGMCDALVLMLFEKARDEDKRSEPWRARQMRKVEGGLQALATWVEHGGGMHIVDNRLTYADIAAMSVLGYLAVRWPDIKWKEQFPVLKTYFDNLDAKESFASTRPTPQTMKDRVV